MADGTGEAVGGGLEQRVEGGWVRELPRAPVARVKTVSPSNMVCTGRMPAPCRRGRSRTPCAHCALVRVASVATTPMVVAIAGRSPFGASCAAAACCRARASSLRVAGRARAVELSRQPEACGVQLAGERGRRIAAQRRSPRRARPPWCHRRGTALADPSPPLSPPAAAPGAGADRRPCGVARSASDHRGVVGLCPERPGRAGKPKSPPRPRSKITAQGTIGTTSPGAPIGSPTPARSSRCMHTVGGGEPERAAAREHHRVHPLDQVARVQQVGLAGARAAAAHVDSGNGAVVGGQDHRGTAQPAVAYDGRSARRGPPTRHRCCWWPPAGPSLVQASVEVGRGDAGERLLEGGDGGDQRAGVGVLGVGVDVAGGPGLDDLGRRA